MKRFFPALFWSLIILVISGFPGDQVPKVPVWQFDKLVHSFVYLILCWAVLLIGHEQYQRDKKRFNSYVLAFVVTIFYGGFMEILQHYIFIKRSGNWYDFIANSVGAVVGVFTYPLMLKIIPINRWLKLK